MVKLVPAPYGKDVPGFSIGQKPQGGLHYDFNGQNVPGYDPKTGAVVGGTLDNNLIQNWGAGIREGLESIPGMLGDFGSLVGAGAAKVAPMLGTATPEQMDQIRGQGMPLPTTQDVQGVTNAVVGQSDPAIGPTEQKVRTGGQFAVGAMAPGGVIRKAAQVAMPAAGSELGAMAADKLGVDERYGRAGGAVIGGGLSQLGGKVNPVKNAAKGAPTKEFVAKGTSDLYKALGDAGISYDRNAYLKTTQDITSDLMGKQFRPEQSSGVADVFKYAKRLEEDAANGSLGFADIDALTKNVGDEMRAAFADPKTQATGKAWEIVLDKLHDFEENAPFTAAPGVSAETVNSARSMARNLALRKIKQRELDKITENAPTYQSGEDAGIRNGIGNLLRSTRGKRLFSTEEKTALLQVAQGNKPLRTLSRFGFDVFQDSGNGALLPALGNFALGSASAAASGDYGVGGMIGLGSAALGTAAKFAVPKMTKKSFEEAGDAIRSRQLSTPGGRLKTVKLLEEQRRRKQIAAGANAAGSDANRQSKK